MTPKGLLGATFAALLVLTACEETVAPRETSTPPEARPAAVAPAPVVPETTAASEASRELIAYYARQQADHLSRGLMRTETAPPDAPFTDTMLVRNFAAIALEEEYVRSAGLVPSSANNSASAIKKWTQPIRMHVAFGESVPLNQIDWDREETAKYAARLSRITGHPITMTEDAGSANFHVLFMSEDDSREIAPRIRRIVPDVNPAALRIFRSLPRGINCLVMAFARQSGGYDYGTAIAVIRSEHPELGRLSCIHEEIAQGLGLANDSPQARPSIFNDDDEFSLLTKHDELLLKLLYDPALRPGMRADEALPIVREKAAILTGGAGPS
jgi:hypothetical protein